MVGSEEVLEDVGAELPGGASEGDFDGAGHVVVGVLQAIEGLVNERHFRQ